MSEKCKVIIVGEEHTATHINKIFKKLLAGYISENSIPHSKVLTFSEGAEVSNLFEDLLKNHKFMIESTAKSYESNPSLEPIINLSAIFAIMKEIHFISDFRKSHPSMPLPEGIIGDYEGFDGQYVRIFLESYGVFKFINPLKDMDKGRGTLEVPGSLISYINTTFTDALQNRPGYERNFTMSLMNAIPYFEKYDDVFPASQLLTELANAPLNQKQIVMAKNQDILRNFRDEIMVRRITDAVTKNQSKLVIMSVGLNHLPNLERLFSENTELFEISELQRDINSVFSNAIGRVTGLPAGPDKKAGSRKRRKNYTKQRFIKQSLKKNHRKRKSRRKCRK